VSGVSLRARGVRIPVQQPTRIASRTLTQRDFVLVWASRDDGEEVGVGYAYAGTQGAGLLARAIEDLLAPIVAVDDADDTVGIWERMYQETLLLGRRGAILRAMSAVDIALWDLAAKRARHPLAVLLAGTVRPVPAYASGGYYRSSDGPWVDAIVSEIEANRQLGFRDHKIKVGGLTVAQDAERVAAAIHAVGSEGRLALDANNAYRSAAEALQALRAFEHAAGEQPLWWFEEPLSADDIAGHAILRSKTDTPIATGELAQTRWEFRDLLERGSADILQPDAGVLGGVTEYMRIVHACEVAGVPVAPHWHANLHAHLAAASVNCIAVEHFTLEKDIYNFERLLAPSTRLQVESGQIHLSNALGIGVEFNARAVEQFAVP
jgi:L-alanine-DL-glutamate epimerase-like enolase superfamily enzyme